MSQRGDNSTIDMLVGDIYGGLDYSKVRKPYYYHFDAPLKVIVVNDFGIHCENCQSLVVLMDKIYRVNVLDYCSAMH